MTENLPASEQTFMEKAWDAQHKVESRIDRLGKGRYARVLKMARKPEPEEFQRSATIVFIGILVVGGIGFLVYLLMDWMMRALGA